MSNPFSEFCPKCDAHHAAGDCLAWLRKQYHDLRAKLQTAEQQLETLQGSLNEAEFHANNYRRSFEEMKAASIASANRANAAEQQLGQVREVNNKLHWALESQPCTCLDGDPCVRCVGLSEWKVDLTPSNGCGKGRMDKERLEHLATLARHQRESEDVVANVKITICMPSGVRDAPADLREAIDKAMEAASSIGKDGGV